MDRKQIENSMRQILARHVSGLDASTIDLATPFSTLAIDSLTLSQIIIDMEETFDFTMSGSAIIKLKTVASTVDYIEQHLK